MRVLVTGAAGFIGFHTAKALLERGDEVIGIDNVNDYYDVRIKYGRLHRDGINSGEAEKGVWVRSDKYPSYRFKKMHLEDRQAVESLFSEKKFDRVCHLAAHQNLVSHFKRFHR